jgi:hypothetical protein
MVREESFLGRDIENPYHHLREFEQLYMQVMKSMNGDWNDLQDSFCLAFFSISHVITLRMKVLGFHQGEEASIGAA